MKKFTLALAFAALMPFVSASAYEYGQTQNGNNATGSYYKKSGTMRKNGGYRNVITNNFYYNQPVQNGRANARQSSYAGYYNNKTNNDYYDAGNYVTEEKPQTKKISKSRTSQERKFFLAHPFFQPLKGKFGSVTDASYAHNDFKFDILNGRIYDVDPASVGYNTYEPFWEFTLPEPLSGKAKTSQFTVKEDFSYGLSDTLALIGMLQYDRTEVSFSDWSDGSAENKKSDSGLNIFGIGLQHRFIDNDKWIGMVAGFFQHQRDTANTFIGDLKIGHKIDRTTVYGLGRIGYSNLIKGDIYGMYADDPSGTNLMLSYKKNVDDIVYVEGGLGVFSVLNRDFTLNGEVIYGHYDWHEQLSAKAALGWQPGSVFALNLYATMSLYDSAKGKTKEYMSLEVNPDTSGFVSPHDLTKAVYTVGDYKINNYNEWKIGVQGIFYF